MTRQVRPRVLVVDDAVVIRRIVTDVLAQDPGLEVVGTAPNGRIALTKIPQCNPDVVTLDVEMPEMDGLATLSAIRETYPTLPVIMFSTLTERGAATTMEALLRGANDYVTKPANVGSVAEAMQQVREALIPRVHALAGGSPARVPTPAAPSRPRPTPVRPTGAPSVEVVVVGVSTGGPNALAQLVPALPHDLGVPVLIVQHMPPMFTRLLAERLDQSTRLQVREARDGEPLAPGQVRVAAGDHHLALRRVGREVRTWLHRGAPENSCRPAADVLFRSASEVYREHTLGVVLTGMGSDGRRGCDHIVAAGGRVLVQDEATSVVWGMPGSVVAAGLAEAVLPLTEIAEAVASRVGSRPSGRGRVPQEVGR